MVPEPRLSRRERLVLDAVRADEVVTDLTALVRIPSVIGTDAEHEVQAWCAERMRVLDLAVDHWRIDLHQAYADPAFPGAEVERTEAWGCVGTLQPAAAGDGGAAPPGTPALVLNGHVDVVPAGPPELWRARAPFGGRVDATGTMWGRGTCDMKAGVAAVFGAVSALRRAGVASRRPLAVHTVIGEEDGGIGTFATLRRGHRGEACLIAEPTARDLVVANAGALTFRLEVAGRAAHAATRSHGVSAVEKFELLHAALRELETTRCTDSDPLLAHLPLAYPISIGTLHAGGWSSTVPEAAVADGRYGVRLDESVDQARSELEQAVAAACAADDWLAAHPARVSWPGGTFASGRLRDGDPLLPDTREAVRDVLGTPPAVRGAPYGSDLRQYTAAGVPTLHYGPGDATHAHAVDEHVQLDDVVRCARVYALLALRRCG
ncbi:MAG: ArgE/DapE family deacylase [Actinomycetota bacterium]|nr:ArgE/DapE family deacylase [Actinomycetota bacterium]